MPDNYESCELPMKMETDDSKDVIKLDAHNKVQEVSQQPQRMLPDVTSLMSNNHLRLAVQSNLTSVGNSEFNQDCTEKADDKPDENAADDSGQHFKSPDKKYMTEHAPSEKLIYMYSAKEDTDNYKEGVSYSLPQHVPKVKQANEFISSETTVTVGALDGRAASEHKAEVSYDDHSSFVNHPPMCYSGHHLEPLSPASAPSEKPPDTCSNVSDRSPVNYSYQNYLSNWEQENNRYFNFTWRNDIYADKAISCFNAGDMGSVKTPAKNNGIVPNMNIDNCCFNKTYVSDASCGSLGSNARRRRRRVQTPVQRTAANMRERRRMCHLNVAFDRLKERLPNIKNKQKLSRIQTLKAAIDYINLLRESLLLR